MYTHIKYVYEYIYIYMLAPPHCHTYTTQNRFQPLKSVALDDRDLKTTAVYNNVGGPHVDGRQEGFEDYAH